MFWVRLHLCWPEKKEREKRTGNRSKLVEGGLVILRLNFIWLAAKTKDFFGVEDC